METIARTLEEWHDDDGCVLWWRFPVREPPYVGSPLSDDWPEYHTHWTPIVAPVEPAQEELHFCDSDTGPHICKTDRCDGHTVKEMEAYDAGAMLSVKQTEAHIRWLEGGGVGPDPAQVGPAGSATVERVLDGVRRERLGLPKEEPAGGADEDGARRMYEHCASLLPYAVPPWVQMSSDDPPSLPGPSKMWWTSAFRFAHEEGAKSRNGEVNLRKEGEAALAKCLQAYVEADHEQKKRIRELERQLSEKGALELGWCEALHKLSQEMASHRPGLYGRPITEGVDVALGRIRELESVGAELTESLRVVRLRLEEICAALSLDVAGANTGEILTAMLHAWTSDKKRIRELEQERDGLREYEREARNRMYEILECDGHRTWEDDIQQRAIQVMRERAELKAAQEAAQHGHHGTRNELERTRRAKEAAEARVLAWEPVVRLVRDWLDTDGDREIEGLALFKLSEGYANIPQELRPEGTGG